VRRPRTSGDRPPSIEWGTSNARPSLTSLVLSSGLFWPLPNKDSLHWPQTTVSHTKPRPRLKWLWAERTVCGGQSLGDVGQLWASCRGNTALGCAIHTNGARFGRLFAECWLCAGQSAADLLPVGRLLWRPICFRQTSFSLGRLCSVCV